MTIDFAFPSSAELTQVSQELMPQLVQDDPIFNLFPIVNDDADLLLWEQKDNYTGLQGIRGLGGAPTFVKMVGGKRYMYTPGYYGEALKVDEAQLTRRRPWGQFQGAIDATDLVMEAHDKLLQRRLNRMRWILWTLLTTGTFAVNDGFDTQTLHTDTYSVQTYSAGTGWGTPATSTPLADLRAVQLKHRGYSLAFDRGATGFMNQVTANHLLSNTNNADVYGRRTAGLGTFNSIDNAVAGMNTLFLSDNLPQVQVYDEGYIDDSNTFHTWIPDNTVVVVGRRLPGDPLGNYRMTRNAMNPDMAPGPYMKTHDSVNDPATARTITVEDGHNGGPVIYHPAGVVIMSV